LGEKCPALELGIALFSHSVDRQRIITSVAYLGMIAMHTPRDTAAGR